MSESNDLESSIQGIMKPRVPTEGSIVAKKVIESDLSLNQKKRLEKFLNFDRLPSPDAQLGCIVLLTTSEALDPTSFAMRSNAAIEFTSKFPDALLILSGKRPDTSRATDTEMQQDYSEAAYTKERLVLRGADQDKIQMEEKSTNYMENINNSMDIVTAKGLNNVIFITSAWGGRRVDFYIRKYLADHGINKTDFTYYISDQDVERERNISSLSEENSKRHQIRKNVFFKYELTRLPEYRKQDSL